MQLASKLRMLDALSRQNAEAVAEVANKGKEITQLTTQIEVLVFLLEIRSCIFSMDLFVICKDRTRIEGTQRCVGIERPL